MTDDKPDLLEMLIRHELVIKQLYEIFAALFAQRQALWQSLAQDEQQHAERLGTLRSDAALGKWLLHGSQLKPQAITSSIRYVEGQIKRAQEGTISLLEALSIAKDLESALLEKHFPKLSNSASQEFRSILLDLAADTERHRKAVAEALDAEKRQVK
jgi:rubrerythrin